MLKSLSIWMCIVLAAFTGCANDRSEKPDYSPTKTDAYSHQQMRETLARISSEAQRTNPFVGSQRLRELRSLESLPNYSNSLSPTDRWTFYRDLGLAELRLGNERAAIQRLEIALDFAGDTDEPSQASQLSHYYLAVAYLRLGETENCCQRNTSESCIVPIKGDGVHAKAEGSRNAIRHLKEVLRSGNQIIAGQERLSTVASAKWLLNIAFMTLGEYPDAVPKKHLVDPSFFAPTAGFPKFPNILPELNLETFNLCGGVVVDDLDGDMDLDIFTCTWDTSGQCRVFRNDGDRKFTDVTEASGLTGFFGGLNVNQTDYDNDGDLDLYVMRGAWLREDGCHPNSLLRNDGNLKFTDVTFSVGLAEPFAPTKTAAWADYDNDGDLDLYVANDTSTRGLQLGEATRSELIRPCQLFRNDGESGFVDVAGQAGVAAEEFSMGAVWGDIDNDGFPDLFLSCVGNNKLFHNNRNGTFKEIAASAGVTEPPSSFASWFFDYDNDGDEDIFVGCNSGPVGVLDSEIRFHLMKLFENDGTGKFKNVAEARNLSYPAEPMGANFGDLDNDGFLDFYLATGNVAFTEIRPNVMFRNINGDRFENVTMSGGFGHLQKGHAVSFADVDNDFDNDVYVQLGGAYAGDRNADALFENPGFTGNQSFMILLEGRASNRAAVGARITATIREDGVERKVYRTVTSGSSFGANPLRQLIGLGKSHAAEKLEIYWPTSNTRQEFSNVLAGKAYRIIEGEKEIRPLLFLQNGTASSLRKSKLP